MRVKRMPGEEGGWGDESVHEEKVRSGGEEKKNSLGTSRKVRRL